MKTGFWVGVVVGGAMVSFGCGTTSQVAPNQPPCVDTETISAESCRVERIGDESIGGLALGMSMDAVFALLGAPDSKGEPEEEAATGDIVTTHSWPARGVQIDGSHTSGDPRITVHRIYVSAPFAGKTLRKIGIGATEAEARSAYADAIDVDNSRPGDALIVGSIFGGVIFDFEAGRVKSVFIGAAAE